MKCSIPAIGTTAIALTSLLMPIHGAYAQVSVSNTYAPLDEIVVTATRREKPLLEVAASVTVQNVDDLQAKGFAYGTDEFRGCLLYTSDAADD